MSAHYKSPYERRRNRQGSCSWKVELSVMNKRQRLLFLVRVCEEIARRKEIERLYAPPTHREVPD
jgi:hypothetical protein